MKPWLLIDANYLCYRAYFALGRLEFDQIATTVVYGFLREVIQLQEQFSTNQIAFCFDFGRPLRKEIFEGYKKRREELSQEEMRHKMEVREQTRRLRDEFLPALGFRNIFFRKGYEADDVIASITLTVPRPQEFVIVSSDHDLFQLLCPRVSMWNVGRKELVTEESFRKEFNINPTAFIDVKAMAGCSTDDIPGIRGIGEKTAAAFLGGRLKPESKKFKLIHKGNKIWERNLALVRLPLDGVGKFKLVKDKVTNKRWRKLIHRLGMSSLESMLGIRSQDEGFRIEDL